MIDNGTKLDMLHWIVGLADAFKVRFFFLFLSWDIGLTGGLALWETGRVFV